jgi:nicotinate dehydrogenase subunit B
MRAGPRHFVRAAAAIAAALVFLFLLFLLWAHRPAIDPVAPPAPSSFAPADVARGANLATIGDCASCHTVTGLAAFAGGVPIETPFGTIRGANITPDPDTGIGRWSEAAFVRAMREGIARDGSHLYPAFPYDHFTQIGDSDLHALYAFLMTRRPIHAGPPSNGLIAPLRFRPFIAAWKALYFRPRRFAADPARDPLWNRGFYLASALGHCGACHTPHGRLGAEEGGRPFAGGWAEGWYAPPLDRSSPAVRAWTQNRLYEYLRTGLSPTHAAAAGPMGSVTRNLAAADPADVRALAAFVADRIGARSDKPLADHAAAAARAFPAGAILFAGACASCHEPGARMMAEGRPPLPLGTPLHEGDPRDTVQIILQGLNPPTGAAGPFMPAFADSFTDAQVAQIAGYLRMRYGSGPLWPDPEKAVARARKGKGP